MKIVSFSSSCPDLLQELNCTLVVNVPEKQGIHFLSADATGPLLTSCTLPGIRMMASQSDKLAIALTDEIVEYRTSGNGKVAGRKQKKNRLAVRKVHRMKSQKADGMAFAGKNLWAIDNLNASLHCLNERSIFRTTVRFPMDRFAGRLSGVAGSKTRPEFISVIASKRQKQSQAGCMVHVMSRETIFNHLTTPVNPMMFGKKIVFNEFSTGEIVIGDPEAETLDVVLRIPGKVTGLAVLGDYLFASVSSAGLPGFFGKLNAGIQILHIPTGQTMGNIRLDCRYIEGLAVISGAVKSFSKIDYQPAFPLPSLSRAASIAILSGTLFFSTPALNAGAAPGPFQYQSGILNPLAPPVSGEMSSKPAFVDIDNDGDQDLFIGDTDGEGIKFFKNIGTTASPIFDNQSGPNNPLDAADPGDLAAPVFADLDGDGDFDVLVGNADREILYFKNTGTAVLPTFIEQTGANNPFGGVDVGDRPSPAIFDIDADGDIDVFIGRGDGRISYFKNTGTSASPVFTEQADPDNPLSMDVGSDASPVFVDIDGDGKLDAVIGNMDGDLKYYQNTGTTNSPAFTEQTGINNPFDGLNAEYNPCPAFTDIDGDGDFDMLSGGEDYYNILTGTTFFKNTGTTNNPSFTEQTGSDNPFGGVDAINAAMPTLIDIDGDGDFDAFIGAFDGKIKQYQNTGTDEIPVFIEQTGANNVLNGVDVGEYATPVFTDIDGDSDFDCFIGNEDGEIKFYENIGTAATPNLTERTGAANPFTGEDVGNAAAPSFVDIDGDNDQDAFIGNSAGEVIFFRNTGTSASPTFTESTGPDKTFTDLDVGDYAAPTFIDIDADGDFDVFIGNGFGEISYFQNVGSVTVPKFTQRFDSGNPFTDVMMNWNAAPSFADIDDDGDADSFIGNGNGHVAFHLNLYYSDPTGLRLSSEQINENLPAGATVGTFTTEDPFADDVFTYTLVSGDGDTNNSLFRIAGSQLQTAVVFDFETKNSYSVRVRTTDSTGSSFERAFAIQVANANDAPTELILVVTALAENLPVGTEIGSFTTSDIDVNESFTYSLVAGDGDTGNALFAIEGNRLKIAGNVDYESHNPISIRVRTTDSGGAYFEKKLSFPVEDINDAPTDISLDVTSIDGELPVGTEVGTFSSFDQDVGDSAAYSLVAGEGDTDNAYFSIEGRILKIAESMSSMTKDSVSIRVRITDSGGLSFEKSIAITLQNVLDAAASLDLGVGSNDDGGGGGCFIGVLGKDH